MTSGNRPAPEQGSWQIPGAASAYEPAAEPRRGAGRGRPGVVALVVALTELVIIAAAANQAVSKHAVRYFLDHESTFLGRAVGSSLQFTWRVTPAHGDNHGGHHVWVSELVTIGVFVVLSALLAGLAARGTVTFWRAFFGIWTAVLAAACVAHVVGALVTKPQPGVGRAVGAVFDSVDGLTVFAGAVIGVIAALVAALVAVSTRRAVDLPAAADAAPEPAYVPPSPPPFYGNAPQPEQPADRDDRTMQLPRVDPQRWQQPPPPSEDGQTTQALPISDDGQATQAMPSAPDDERR